VFSTDETAPPPAGPGQATTWKAQFFATAPHGTYKTACGVWTTPTIYLCGLIGGSVRVGPANRIGRYHDAASIHLARLSLGRLQEQSTVHSLQ
jgi:hypothetical protein